MLTITIAELRAFAACDLEDRIAALTAHLGRPVADDEPVPLLTWAEVTPAAADLIWALRCCWDRGGRVIGVEIACRAAERGLDRLPEDRRAIARAAIDAARGCVAGTVTREECLRAAHAAYAVAVAVASVAARNAAYAAAYAAYAAYAAAYAAYAAAAAEDASAAADDAADAADAAADAADAAAYASADAARAAAAERALQRADLIALLTAGGAS